MKKKKLGNSLIVVVTTVMFVTTVSAATLTMVAGNYKARSIESKRVENLYASDSGLNVAYNVIGKSFDAAVTYGYYEVEALKNEDPTRDSITENNQKYIDLKAVIRIKQAEIQGASDKKTIAEDNEIIKEDNDTINIVINDEFKRAFNNFITGNYPSDDSQPSGTPKTLIDYVEKNSYQNVRYDDKSAQINFTPVTVNFTGSGQPTLWIPVEGQDKGDKDGVPDDFNGFSPGNGSYSITVKSIFKTTVASDEIPRIVQATYTITVPNYDYIFSKHESGQLHDYLALNDRALTIGGDMNVNNANSVDVNGNIFVSGNPDNNSADRVYGKYFGGITLNNSDSVSFDKNVITRGTFNLQNDVKDSTIKGDLYAGNIYAGNKDGTSTSDSNFTAENSVIIDNDLAVNASNTKIEIGSFYGINDKTIYYNNGGNDQYLTTENGNYNEKPKARTSSSIIINNYKDNNGQKPSSVTIDHEAYIMGTAHINTNKDDKNGGYQTGESAAVKGNYEAYSVPIDDLEKFNYYDPLQLLDDSNVFNKAEHFRKYWKPDINNGEVKKTDKEADNGGIIFNGGVHSVGAVVYKHEGITEVSSDLYDPKDITATIIPKQFEYAKNVYKFGQNSTMDDYNSLGTNALQVSDLMNLSQTAINNAGGYNLAAQISNNQEKAIFNPVANNTIVIKGDHSTEEYDDPNKYIVIDGTNNKEVNAVIATVGDVIIDGDVNFYGSIITDRSIKSDGTTVGNLTITGNVSINYNKEIIDRIQQQNPSLFLNVFGGYILDDVESTSDSPNPNIDITNINYDLKKFLQSSKWRIIE